MFKLIVPSGIQILNKYPNMTLKMYKGSEDKAPHFHNLSPAWS